MRKREKNANVANINMLHIEKKKRNMHKQKNCTKTRCYMENYLVILHYIIYIYIYHIRRYNDLIHSPSSIVKFLYLPGSMNSSFSSC